MKAVMLNGEAKRSAANVRRVLKGKSSRTTAATDGDRMARMLGTAQEMGDPLNVVLGRMEYLLGRGVDKETARNLKTILSQAQRLVELRRQLIDEARLGFEAADTASSFWETGA